MEFFAASNGKSVADGLKGAIKQLTARASFQRPQMTKFYQQKQIILSAKFAARNL